MRAQMRTWRIYFEQITETCHPFESAPSFVQCLTTHDLTEPCLALFRGPASPPSAAIPLFTPLLRVR